MKKLVLASLVSLAFAPESALAQERGSDAALGAVSGAVVLGPVGAVAGAVIGYTAGPSIARSWGLRRSASRRPSRSGTSPSRVSQNTPMAANPESGTMTAAAPSAPRYAAPPVQGLE